MGPPSSPSTGPASSPTNQGGAITLKKYKYHIIWKATKKAHRMPGRELLNQTAEAHNAESFATIAFQRGFKHAAESPQVNAEDRGFMVIGSAFIPEAEGSATLKEVNRNPNHEEAGMAKHYMAFKKDDDRGSSFYYLRDDNTKPDAFNDRALQKLSEDGTPFNVILYHRGRYLATKKDYEHHCPVAAVEKDRGQAPTISVADQWKKIAISRLSAILSGSDLQWYSLGSHLAGLPSDAAREHVLQTLEPAEAFAELTPKNPLNSEQLQYLKDAGSHSHDMVAANRRRMEALEKILDGLSGVVTALKVQVELLKEASIQDEQRVRSYQAHIRLTENKYAMYWARRVADAYDDDHEDARYQDPARGPLVGARSESGGHGEQDRLGHDGEQGNGDGVPEPTR